MKKKFSTWIGLILALAICLTVIPACSSGGEGGEPEPTPATGAGLTVSQSELTMNVNTTYQLTATVNDSTAYTITWASSDTEVATVQSGLVTALSAGSATITVSCRKKGSTAVAESKTCAVTVVNRQVVLNTDSVLILPDTSATATVTASVEGVSDSVVWSSQDEGIATVTDGVITGRRTGTTTVTATAGDISATCRVTVANKASLEAGKTVALTSTLTSPVWASTNPEIATVTDGVVTGVGLGTTTVTATADGVSESFILSVVAESEMKSYTLVSGKKADAANNPGIWNYLLESTNATISDIPVFKNGVLAIDITHVGDSGTNFAYLRYQPDSVGGIYYHVRLYIYAAADAIIAINGVDTTVTKGDNFLTVDYNSKQPSAQDTFQFKFRTATAYIIAPYFEVAQPEAELTLNKTSIELLTAEGFNTETLVATYEENSVFTWASSDEGVATVVDGVVTAVAEGAATITVSSGSKQASCTVVVSSKSVTLSQTFATLYLLPDENGTTKNSFTLTATASDGSEVTWSSSDSSVVTVDENGLITAVAKGWATVTATMAGASRDCTVFVVNSASNYKLPKGNKADFTTDTYDGIWTNGNDATWNCNWNDGVLTTTLNNALTSATKFMFRYKPFFENFVITYTIRTSVGAITINDTGSAGVIELTAEEALAGKRVTSTVALSAGSYWQLSIYGNSAGEVVTVTDISFSRVA